MVDLVWKPLAPHLLGADTVLVSPDGYLQLFPLRRAGDGPRRQTKAPRARAARPKVRAAQPQRSTPDLWAAFVLSGGFR